MLTTTKNIFNKGDHDKIEQKVHFESDSPIRRKCKKFPLDVKVEQFEENQYSKVVFMQGRDGHKGAEGPNGQRGNRLGDLNYSLITPNNSTTVILLNPNDDIIEINTSNFSPTLNLGIPSSKDCESGTHYLEIRLLFQRGLPAEIQVSSGGTFEISAANPNVLLFWDGTTWNVLENPADISSFLPNAVRPTVQLTPNDALAFVDSTLFNYNLAISSGGNTIALGGHNDNSENGATWIFTRSGLTWTQQGPKLVGTGGIGESNQGASVSLSADGNTLAVGGPNDNSNSAIGATWIFVRNAAVWTQQGPKLVGTGFITSSAQGTSVALSADGNTLAVGGPFDNDAIGAVWVFRRSGGFWFQIGDKLVPSDPSGAPNMGSCVAISADGTTIVTGGFTDNAETGAVWIFTLQNGIWTQQGPKLVPTGLSTGNNFGRYISLSADGNTLASSAINYAGDNGAVFIFVRGNGGIWTQQAGPLVVVQPVTNPTATEVGAVTLSADGNTLAVGGSGDNNLVGALWIFRRIMGNWTQFEFKLIANPPPTTLGVGRSIAMNSNGSVLVAGSIAYPTGVISAYVFQ